MQAGASLSSRPVAPEGEMYDKSWKINHMRIHTCMHAGLLGTPFRSGCGKQSKVIPRKLCACMQHACMHAYIMHAHRACVRDTQYCDDAGNQLRSIITNPRNNYDTCDARQPPKPGYVKQFEVALHSFSTTPWVLLPGPVVTYSLLASSLPRLLPTGETSHWEVPCRRKS